MGWTLTLPSRPRMLPTMRHGEHTMPRLGDACGCVWGCEEAFKSGFLLCSRSLAARQDCPIYRLLLFFANRPRLFRTPWRPGGGGGSGRPKSFATAGVASVVRQCSAFLFLGFGRVWSRGTTAQTDAQWVAMLSGLMFGTVILLSQIPTAVADWASISWSFLYSSTILFGARSLMALTASMGSVPAACASFTARRPFSMFPPITSSSDRNCMMP